MTITTPSTTFGWILSALILIGAVPMLCSVFQFFLVAFHRWFSHYDKAAPAYTPRVAVLVPAWNEALVLDFSVERMMALDYPQDRLRLVIVDDASTDETPTLLQQKQERYPGRIVVLRRQQGGQGKSHTLNHGLDVILDDDWAQAVLITDADVVFAPDAIAKLSRHLADPEVGAVMGFIREASSPPHWLSRYIGYEYATAQLAARRAQNVVGAQACLAGGAQLLSRDNLEALGGRMDTATLAEDTVTTFLTQMRGRKVIFDPNAQCFAEEPASVTGLWKQRLRWSRGNLQVFRRFHSVFFRPSKTHHPGNAWLGLQWYSTLLLPALMVLVSMALIAMWLFDAGDANLLFRIFWSISAFAFVFTTIFTLTLDRRVAARSWRQAFFFPGLINLSIMAFVIAPGPMTDLIRMICLGLGLGWTDQTRSFLALFAYAWTSVCMVFSWLIFRLDRLTWMGPVLSVFMLVVGFGPFLCSITFAAYIAQLRGAATTWDKTEKTGKVAVS